MSGDGDYPGVYTLQALKQDNRFSQLVEAFVNKYGAEPTFIARAPGRVNLIGEHIDYMGYGVLPMAIEQDVMIAGRTSDTHKLKISNFDSSKYSDYECESKIDSSTIDKSSPKWYHYFMCGYLGMVEHLGTEKSDTGLDLMVWGRVPPSAGLSSSSAFVCASALITATLLKEDAKITKTQFAQVCCECEKYIGTMGGGMDQSISFLADQGKAKKIDFDPIRAADVTLPAGHVFVISHCLAELNKAATSHFNQRVVECRLACQCIAKKLGLQWDEFRRLGDLQAKLGKSLDEMLELVDEHLHQGTYTKQEVLQILGATDEQLLKTSLNGNTAHLTEFKLNDRAHHVFSEAGRVEKFKQICDSAAEADSAAHSAAALGNLMSDSHSSTQHKYECSHPDLDLLVQSCLDSGALGARLTGAGWGGCAVSIVPESNVESFLQKVEASFYSDERLKGRPLYQVLFQTAPASGACLYKIPSKQ